jgi:hypothetical protein
MLDDAPAQHQPRARAVAELPSEPLLACAGELATRWAIALIHMRPLEEIGGVPLEELAREAPALCAQVLRAVQSEIELERLTGQRAASARESSALAKRLAPIAGARDAVGVAQAVEALRGVLWEALRAHLLEPSARLVGDVSDRLAYVCAAALVVAMEALSPAPESVPADDDAHVGNGASETLAGEFSRTGSPARQAVIVDEGTGAQALVRERFVAEIEIRDERHEQGPAPWIRSIGAQLERFARDKVPFAVLLVELVELERLRREETSRELSALCELMEHALAYVLAPLSGSLTRERPGRCWLLVPDTNRARASELADRLAVAVSVRASGTVAPPQVAVGTAVCPDDGLEAAALAAHADVGLYAARSAARASAGPAASSARESD